MFIFSNEECVKYAARRNILSDSQRPIRCGKTINRLGGKIPQTSGGSLDCVRGIMSAVLIESECLVWISDWNIFSSQEYTHIFYRFRQSYGVNAPVANFPGHLCLASERAEIICLVQLCILNCWDVHVFPDLSYSALFFSHDQRFEIGLSEPELRDEEERRLKAVGLAVEKITTVDLPRAP